MWQGRESEDPVVDSFLVDAEEEASDEGVVPEWDERTKPTQVLSLTCGDGAVFNITLNPDDKVTSFKVEDGSDAGTMGRMSLLPKMLKKMSETGEISMS